METVRLTGVFWQEGNQFVPKCLELGVASCGDTVEEAMRNLREAVELCLENARKLGLIEQMPFLAAAGTNSSRCSKS